MVKARALPLQQQSYACRRFRSPSCRQPSAFACDSHSFSPSRPTQEFAEQVLILTTSCLDSYKAQSGESVRAHLAQVLTFDPADLTATEVSRASLLSSPAHFALDPPRWNVRCLSRGRNITASALRWPPPTTITLMSSSCSLLVVHDRWTRTRLVRPNLGQLRPEAMQLRTQPAEPCRDH